MKQRILAAAILMPGVLAAIFLFPFWLFLMLVDSLLLIGARELFRILHRYGASQYWITYPFLMLLPWIWCFSPAYILPLLMISVLSIACWSVAFSSEMEQAFPSVSGNSMTLFYLGIPFSLIAGFHPGSPGALDSPQLPLELLMVLLTVWAGDSLAFLVGKRWGTHHVTPQVSPNKSLEGFTAAMVASIILPPLFGIFFLPSLPFTFLTLAGLMLGAGGILGDLFESILKRGAGVKDSSHLIPGHGGLLDRIDSILFAVPIYYLTAILVD